VHSSAGQYNKNKYMATLETKQFNYTATDLPCAGCQAVFKDTDAVIVWGNNEKRWHASCFMCKGCAAKFELLSNGKWMHNSGISESNGFPYCGNCYKQLFEFSCDECNNAITGPYVDLFGRRFHEQCFLCDGCKKPLTGHCLKRPKEKKAFCRECAKGNNDGKKSSGFVIDPRTGQKKYAS